MTGFLTRLISRSAGDPPAIRPQIASFFELPEKRSTAAFSTTDFDEQKANVGPTVSVKPIEAKSDQSETLAGHQREAQQLKDQQLTAATQRSQSSTNEGRIGEGPIYLAAEKPAHETGASKPEPNYMPNQRDAASRRGAADPLAKFGVPAEKRSNSKNHNAIPRDIPKPSAVRELILGLPVRKRTGTESEVARISPFSMPLPASSQGSSSAAAEKRSESVVQVSIGRVEVRAILDKSKTENSPNKMQGQSLDEYQLRREQRGRR
ncbi:MAG TPA: hypothetical protein VKD70_11895 [Candidatus Acidoferrum sp.]|nr:hypothetical protein [Candidatus Acidoferrum sp.]